MRVFDFDDYKSFVKGRVKAMPRKGRGQFKKIASHLQIHTTMVSQIFGGDKNLNLEQACLLSEYFGMSELETDFFVGLVEWERAGNRQLKRLIERRLTRLREQATLLASRVPKAKPLSEQNESVFYSQWYYSGIRLLSSIPGHHDFDSIAQYFGLSKPEVSRVIEFLLENGLCVDRGGKIELGAQRTHIAADSPLVSRHHINWRLKAIEKLPKLSSREVAFTSPMSIAVKDADLIRKAIGDLVEKVSVIVEPSPPEKLACLNIDWFEV